MAEDTGSADPSMEEILASIRKIISDDNPPAEVAPASVAPEPAPPAAAAKEDVVELTQMIQDDGSVVDLAEIELETTQTPEPPVPPAPVAAAPPPPTPLASSVVSETLVSSPAAQSAASALSALANTVEIERLASSPLTATALGNGGRTLEDMVIELMRPLLKGWLDQNLPAIVDRLVQKEIERISRRT